MKSTPLKRYTPLKSGGLLKRSSLKPKKTQRAKKMELKRLIIEQYGLPSIKCSRWGTAKSPSRKDILKGMLWTVFGQYIRQRDAGVCISCNMYKMYEELQAGHFAPVGGNDIELCFDEQNVNGECSTCNADFDGWHLVPMRRNLVRKYGEEAVLAIEKRREQKRVIIWDEAVYVEKIFYYYQKLKQ